MSFPGFPSVVFAIIANELIPDIVCILTTIEAEIKDRTADAVNMAVDGTKPQNPNEFEIDKIPAPRVELRRFKLVAITPVY